MVGQADLPDQEKGGRMIREELKRLFTWEERHRRLAARLLIALSLSVVVLAIGSVLIWVFESGIKGGNIHGFGDAVFFTTVQLLTVSSSMTNPLTVGGRVVDVALEAWAIFVVTAVAGSFASFFSSGDSG
jgi:drug/metabolite transporter (DMT)-like permease